MLSLARCTPVRRPFSAVQPVKPQKLVVAKAYIEASTTFAVLQQSVAFAAVAAGEGLYTRSQTQEGRPGRPEIVPVAGGAAGCLVAAVLASTQNEGVIAPALALGLVASIAIFAYTLKRTIDTKATADETDWPGPKTLPATMALICFFEMCVYIQAIRAEL